MLSVKVDRKRKMPVTILLRAIGYDTDEQLFELFADVDTNPDHRYIQTTLDKEPTKTKDEALIELYRRLRPGDPPTRDNAPRPAGEPVLQPPPLRPGPGRPLQAEQAPARDQVAPDEPRPRVLTKEDLVEIIREDDPPQQRRRRAATTSTTSATAASARSAS